MAGQLDEDGDSDPDMPDKFRCCLTLKRMRNPVSPLAILPHVLRRMDSHLRIVWSGGTGGLMYRNRHDDPVTSPSLSPPSPSLTSPPVPLCQVLALDGHTYEEAAIRDWFAKSLTSPMTGLPLESDLLIPIVYVRRDIAEWMEQQRAQRGAEAKGEPEEAKGEAKGEEQEEEDAEREAKGERQGHKAKREPEEAEGEATGEPDAAKANVTGEAEGEEPIPPQQGPEPKEGQGEEPREGAKSAGGERRARRRVKNKRRQEEMAAGGGGRGLRGFFSRGWDLVRGKVSRGCALMRGKVSRACSWIWGKLSRGFLLMRGKGLVGLLATTALAIVLCGGAPWATPWATPVSCGDAILASRAAVTADEQANALLTLIDQVHRAKCDDVLPALSLEAPAAMRRWPGDLGVQGAACSLVMHLAGRAQSAEVLPPATQTVTERHHHGDQQHHHQHHHSFQLYHHPQTPSECRPWCVHDRRSRRGCWTTGPWG
jgi:hypothetical protein